MPRRRADRSFSVVAFGLAMPLAVFAYLAADLARTGDIGWDDELAPLAQDVVAATPVPLDGAWLLDNSNAAGALVLAVLAAVLLLAAKKVHAAFWMVAVGGIFVLDPLLKALFQRPGFDGEYSFPSGSALFGAAAVAAVASLIPTLRLRVAAAFLGAAFCFLYGAAIVSASWHYPSDVVAGWAFGVAWTTALWLAFSTVSSRTTTSDAASARHEHDPRHRKGEMT